MVKPFFTKEEEKEIVEAIQAAERGTTGEIRVHVRKQCKKHPLAEAQQIFKKLNMQRTTERNGVLIFVAAESH